MILKNKKELQNFIDNRENSINYLISKLNENKVSVKNVDECYSKIDEIQKFYEDYFLMTDIETQNKLRLGFWSLFSKIVMEKLGGELKIASPTDYAAGTPQLINYGNKYDKKGKKKWIGIAFDSWLNTLLKGKLFGTLKETVYSLIEDYS
jgi:hypothetical protein